MRMFKQITTVAGAAIVLCTAPVCATAATITVPTQAPAQPLVYTLASINGTNLATTASFTNTAVTFPVYPGRGFRFNAAFVATNASTAAIPFLLQFATVHRLGGTLETNWNTANQLTIVGTLAGTAKQYLGTNIGPLTVDNCTLGRLYTVTNAHTSTILIDTTNTFISVFP